MALTTNFKIPKPDEATRVNDEFRRLQQAWDLVDAVLKAISDKADGRAPAEHGHPISAIEGLAHALSELMPRNAQFKLDDLTDVQGAAGAPGQYILVKNGSGLWVPSSPVAALGTHHHLLSEVTGLPAALTARPERAEVEEALDELLALMNGRHFWRVASGEALPSTDIGPIWHTDYNSMMVWAVFNQNGANYAGYVSVEIGKPSLDGMQWPRLGWLKKNGASVPISKYPALWNWAVHYGRTVPLGSWTAGPYVFAYNEDGATFRLPDTRGRFPREWSDGATIDSGRAFGSAQDDEIREHAHLYGQGNATGSGNNTIGVGPASNTTATSRFGGSETRPFNTALLGLIKY